MNTWGLSALGKMPARLWRRFRIWRAMRMYVRVIDLEVEARCLKIEADLLMRKHAEDPQQRLDLGDD